MATVFVPSWMAPALALSSAFFLTLSLASLLNFEPTTSICLRADALRDLTVVVRIILSMTLSADTC